MCGNPRRNPWEAALRPNEKPPIPEAAGGEAVREARDIVVTGRVQGVGYRPFVYVTACELGISRRALTYKLRRFREQGHLVEPN